MAFFTLRLSDDLAARFDAASRPVGGRSAALRALILAACGESGPVGPQAAAGVRDRRIELRFSASELDTINRLAAARGLRRSDWMTAAIRAHLGRAVRPPRDVQSALVDAWRQIKKIGINLNQAVHAVNSAVMAGSRLDLATEAARIEQFREEVSNQLAAIGAALEGDLAYWRAEP
jgi:hypothetical protein